MKYLLLMSGTREGVKSYQAWPQADIATHFAELIRINAELAANGELVSIHGLASPEEAKLVRASTSRGVPTDGVFPESKEFVLGFWLVEVKDEERAFEIARLISGAPGPSGVPTAMPIEVRRVVNCS